MKKTINRNDFIILIILLFVFMLGIYIGMIFEQMVSEDDKIIQELRKEQLTLEIKKLKSDGCIK